MYHYSICTIADEVIFQKQCRALETHLPHLVKDELLEDVDGSLMQRYCPYIASEVELEPYFRDKSREKTSLAE
jgi:hypothetical protein